MDSGLYFLLPGGCCRETFCASEPFCCKRFCLKDGQQHLFLIHILTSRMICDCPRDRALAPVFYYSNLISRVSSGVFRLSTAGARFFCLGLLFSFSRI